MLQFLHPSRLWSFVVQARGTHLRLVGCGKLSLSPVTQLFALLVSRITQPPKTTASISRPLKSCNLPASTVVHQGTTYDSLSVLIVRIFVELEGSVPIIDTFEHILFARPLRRRLAPVGLGLRGGTCIRASPPPRHGAVWKCFHVQHRESFVPERAEQRVLQEQLRQAQHNRGAD